MNVYSCRSGADNPSGPKFWCQQKPLVASVICYKFQKISLKSYFIQFFSWFYTCIYPQGSGWQPLGVEIFMSTGTSWHFGHLLQVSKKSLWSLILYNFFHDFTHVYIPGAGADSPQGTNFLMSTEMFCHFIYLLQVSKKCLWSLILYIFFHDLIHVYSPGAGADSPQGDIILMSTERPYHFTHLLQVSKKSLLSDFIHVYSDYSPKAGPDNLGTKFVCQQEHLVTSVICCKFKKKCFWNLILYNFFSWFYTYI